MPVLIDLADAVADTLNAGSFSLPLTAERHYRPVFDLQEMAGLKVSVVPRGLAGRPLDRGRDIWEYMIDIGIQQKVDVTPAALDPLMGLVEEIADRFRRQPIPGTDARCVRVENEPAYSPEHLESLRQFTSVLTLTLRVRR